MSKYICTICGFIYDEALGLPDKGIKAGTKFSDLPDSWTCPVCGAPKSAFELQKETPESSHLKDQASTEEKESLASFSIAEFSAICSNLARGCEKQYLGEEAELFRSLADFFTGKTESIPNATVSAMQELVKEDIDTLLPNADEKAKSEGDRGALRALVWDQKVSRIVASILDRYQKEGKKILENKNIYVCTACGFVFIGDNPPPLCPVCKVPSWRFEKIERRKAK